MIDAADVDAARAELAEHPLGEHLEVVLRVVAASDPGLVGDDNGEQSRVQGDTAQVEDSGKKLERLDASDVALVDVDDSITVEKERLVPRVYFHLTELRLARAELLKVDIATETHSLQLDLLDFAL